MKKKIIFLGILLCAVCFLTAAAAEDAGNGKTAARLPAKLTVIGEDAFAGTAFEAVELPGSISRICRT